MSTVEGGLYPLQLTGLHQHHIKPAGRALPQTTQITTRRKHNALAFECANAGDGAAVPGVAAASHLDKNQGALRVAHNQVNLTAAAPGRAVIALHQLQATVLQKCQRLVLGGIAFAFGAVPAARCVVWFVLKGSH